MVFVFVWLISLNIIPSKSIHVVTNSKICVFLQLSSIPLCIYIPHLLNPFIYQWTFRLFPCLGYCEQCCNEHRGCMHLFWWKFCLDICLEVGLLDHMVVYIYNWVTMLYSRNWHNTVNYLHSNKKRYIIPHKVGYRHCWILTRELRSQASLNISTDSSEMWGPSLYSETGQKLLTGY